MNIGVITYYRVANFGANLQALSTYYFLSSKGHNVTFIHYMSKGLYEATDLRYDEDAQIRAHLDFVDKHIVNQSVLCFSPSEVNDVIKEKNIQKLIIGSDAVLQHHPLLSRIEVHRKHRIFPYFVVHSVNKERLFPNLFWGHGLQVEDKCMISVSSQNSSYKQFSPFLKYRMRKALKEFSYISVRDDWTRSMVHSIMRRDVPVTPDPVFAFNQNFSENIPNKSEILNKFALPDKYVLFSILNTWVNPMYFKELKMLFESVGIKCVALPTPLGVRFENPFDITVNLPLDPIDWYCMIKYSSGYIGNNMHPVIIALHNGVPCFSIDNYYRTDWRGRPIIDESSKIYDILKRFNLLDNYSIPVNGELGRTPKEIFRKMMDFPVERVKNFSGNLYQSYVEMMNAIIQ